jgi:aryl-alcohol dehydrogenase-like predicted oxidoreductase
MADWNSKLAIGTANFGLAYGVTNNNGRLSDIEIKNIMDVAKSSKITTFDTAQGYGDSEERLGPFLNNKTNVVTKIGIELQSNDISLNLQQNFTQRLEKLKCDKVYALLLHNPEVLLGRDGATIIRELRHLKCGGFVKKIGVSIYNPEILKVILRSFEVDIVQLPFNIFDREVCFTGWVDKLKEKDIEIHTRSVFLQGILLMQRHNLPNWFRENWPEIFDQWFDFQKQVGATADEIALTFVLRQPWIDKVVVGVDNFQQLTRLAKIEKNMKKDYKPTFFSRDANLINPSKWEKS